MLNQLPQPYAPVIIKLLKGVMYHHDPDWETLISYETSIRDYFAKIGIDVKVYKTDGFAYLTQPKEIELEGKRVSLPRLTNSRGLNPKTTIFCVLLRMELQKFDAQSIETGRLILSVEKLRELLEPYFQPINDEPKFNDNVDTLINRVKDLGILKQISEDQYEILRIINAKINVEQLEELKQKLEQYANVSVS